MVRMNAVRGPLAAAVVGSVIVVCSASARPIRTAFNYQFDSGGDKADFYHNSPRDGGTLSWQPGGALDSLGSLKVAGPAASFERFDYFRSGDDTTLSFHYFAHGYTDIELRLNPASAQDRERFDRAAAHFERPCKQDQWVFVQLPVAGLPGLTRKDRGAPAGMTYKSLTFIARATKQSAQQLGIDIPGDQYLLIDNVRLGPPIQEGDIRIRQRTQRSFGTKRRQLVDPGSEGATDLLVSGAGVAVDVVRQAPHTGRETLRLSVGAAAKWATFELAESLLAGWAGYDYLVLDFYSDDAGMTPITVELWDHRSRDYASRCTYEDRFGLPPVHKGKTRVLVDLRKARRNSKEGLSFLELSDTDKPDLDQVRKAKIWFTTTGRDEDYVVYLDAVHLMQEGALDGNMKIALPKGAIAFDFGENSPLVRGFTEVNLLDVYGSGGSTYGFVAPDDICAEGRDWPDALTGDYVGGGHDASGAWREGSFEFRADVPNGNYLVWVNAAFFPYPNLYVDANVNGKILFSGELDADTLYTRRWYYRFFDAAYSEKPHSLWERYVATISPGHVLETEVSDGTFFFKGANSTIGACVLVPVKERKAFDEMVAQIRRERIRYFYKDLYLDRPNNQPCAVTDADLVLFVPSEGKTIKPWSGVGTRDARAVDTAAARGEAIAFQVALRPFRELGETTVAISDLIGPADARIAAERVEVFLKKYISDGMRIRDWGLMPGSKVSLEKDLARTFWFRVRVPRDASGGTYRGFVTAASGSVTRKLPVTLEVFPFALEEDIPLAVGLYYLPPDGGQFSGYEQLEDFAAQRDRMLTEQAELLHEYGMTASQVPAPAVKELRGSGVALDTSAIAKVCRTMQAAGMLANDHQKAMPYMLSVARAIGNRLGQRGIEGRNEVEMAGFETAYYSAVQQTVNWAADNGVPLILWVVDEPREMPNPWNRNLDDTIAHLKIIEGMPGATRMSTPMGDTNKGKDYMPLLDHLEVVATHPTPHSAKMIARAMKDPELGLWIYNAGRDRYSNGFYVWRVGATGKFEWHFSMWTHEKKRGGYMGSEMHNPFLNYEYNGTFVSAPLTYKGAVLPTESLMTMSMGINDYRYLYTLERAIAAAGEDGTKQPALKEATQFLADLRQGIPVIPETKGLSSVQNLADVGKGLAGDQRLMLDTWRRQVAALIVALQ